MKILPKSEVRVHYKSFTNEPAYPLPAHKGETKVAIFSVVLMAIGVLVFLAYKEYLVIRQAEDQQMVNAIINNLPPSPPQPSSPAPSGENFSSHHPVDCWAPETYGGPRGCR